MEIINKKIEELIPYEKNPRKNDEAVDYVANSIKEFGFKVPIVIDKNNVIIAGHTRLKASKQIGLKEVPCIIADDLTEEQVKAFRLADNKVSEESLWDFSKLAEELDNLDIDMEQFGFEDIQQEEVFKENERHRTNDKYNLDLVDIENSTNDFWQMPIIEKNDVIPNDLIELNSLNVEDNTKKWNVDAKDVAIHFYMDDYKLERLWNKPEDYIKVLSQYKCVLSPDFSLYLDMPMPMKIWNVYRSRQLGHYYQEMGIKVIPTIQWAEKETFEFCFKGIPKGSIVSVSTIGVKRDENALKIWNEGMDAMIKEIEPSTILVYGGELEYDYGDIKVIYYENKITERLIENGKK